MANPQKENGYTSISNELMEALARTRISGEQRQLLDFILRKTYGYNKKEDKISLSQFVLGTGLKKPNICRGLKSLEAMNIIIKTDNAKANIYGILKNYDKWKPLSKVIIHKKALSKVITPIINIDNPSLSKMIPTITTTTKAINTITSISDETSQLPIKEVFNRFYDLGNKGINFGNKTERSAAEWLVKQYGLEKTLNTIDYAMSLTGVQYAPVITTPFQLKNNMVKLIAYYKREQEPKKGVVPKFKL